MGLLVGIDGGGTGCRAAIADPSGRILATATGGPANIATDPAAALRAILSTAEQALQAATGSCNLADLTAGLGLAGANAAGAVVALRPALPFARSRIETDAIATALGALGGQDGILAAIGTGSVFVRQTGGQLHQAGGRGFVLGDEGSGAALGRAALALALRAADGLAKATPFLTDLVRRYGGADALTAFSLSARPADFAALAPEILASPDPAARAIWAGCVSDIAEIIARLQPDAPLPAPLPVTFTGGLGPAYAAALAHLPQRPALGTALDGALLLARAA